MPYRLPSWVVLTLLLTSAPSLAQTKPAAPSSGDQSLARARFAAQMDTQFRNIDADGNGQLTVAEIEQFEKQKSLAEAQLRNDALFDQLDTNKNGQISATEFAKLVREPAAVSAQPMLSREDANRDSQISLVEHRSATLANFDRLDTDKDGVVTAAEMKAGGLAPR